MGVERRHSHVKFSKTIRLGKNLDLDNAAAGEVEVGSLRDTGTNVQRWNGTFWENIGTPITTKEISFADTPYSVKNSDEFITVDASGGVVVVNILALSVATKPLWIDKNENSANTVDVTTTVGADKINGLDVYPIASLDEGYSFTPFTSQYRAL